jgi:hypothetical protein
MIDAYEMLRRKENDIVRVRKEIQALRFVVPMLLEPDEIQVLEPDAVSGTDAVSLEHDRTVENPPHDEASQESADLTEGIPPKRSRLRELLGLAAGE